MISDLLADSNLPPNVASTLKIISTMIAPPTAFHAVQRPFVSPMTPLIEKFRDESQEDKVRDQPDLKDDMPLPMVGVRVFSKHIFPHCIVPQNIQYLFVRLPTPPLWKFQSRFIHNIVLNRWVLQTPLPLGNSSPFCVQSVAIFWNSTSCE